MRLYSYRSIAKTRRAQAERAAEWVLREHYACVLTRRAVRTKWQSIDFFGADVVGKDRRGRHVYVQATAGKSSAVAARRRKLESVPWLVSDLVLVLQLSERQNVNNARRKDWFFRVHCYARGDWLLKEPIEIKLAWFKAWKPSVEIEESNEAKQ